MSSFRQDVEATVPALRRYARALTRDAVAVWMSCPLVNASISGVTSASLNTLLVSG